MLYYMEWKSLNFASWSVIFGFVVCFIYFLIKHVVEKGFYIPISRKFAVRMYVFPKKTRVQEKISAECISICESLFDGKLLSYSFLNGEVNTLQNRVVIMFYSRSEPDIPIGFSASFVTDGWKYRIFLTGLMLIRKEFQHHGIQKLTSIPLFLYNVFNRKPCVVMNIANNPSYMAMQKRYFKEYFPNPRCREQKPLPWQLEAVRYFITAHRDEVAPSTEAYLDEDKLVFRDAKIGSMLKEYTITRRTRNAEIQNFFDEILGENDEQIFVAIPKTFLVLLYERLMS